MQTKTLNTKPKVNELGFEMISDQLWSYLFDGERPSVDRVTRAEIEASFRAFEGYKFPPDTEGYEGFNLDVPKFDGSLQDYVNNLAATKWQPVKNQLLEFLNAGISETPDSGVLLKQAGWTRYEFQGRLEKSVFDFDFTLEEKPEESWAISKVTHPTEDTLVFDVETFVKQGNGPVLAVAVSNAAWYLWIHPALASSNVMYSDCLIPLGNGKLILNHNPKFDSTRVAETYDLSLTNRNIWLDTMSMHMAICGMSSKQRVPYKAYLAGSQTFASKWATQTSDNSLVAVYNHHVKPLKPLTKADKATRNIFVNASNVQEFRDCLDELLDYNLKDGLYTYRLGQAIVPKYFRSQPSIISFGGSCILSKSFLPVQDDWEARLFEIDKAYAVTKKQLKKDIEAIAHHWANGYKSGKLTQAVIDACPWKSQLDWTPAKSGANKGFPAWWRKAKSKGISTGSRLAPRLLKMCWQGQPLVHHPKLGWMFKALPSSPTTVELPNGIPGCLSQLFKPGQYQKVPHKKGDANNCGNPLAKDYIDAIDSGLLSSPNESAKDFLEAARSIAYWTSMRTRAHEYKPKQCVYPDGTKGLMVEPVLAYFGTASRRCVERLWLTVSSAKPKVIGSELKGMVRPVNWQHDLPKDALGNYEMLGYDFDAQELKIASSYADALAFGIFGSSPMGYTQLLGDKDKKTDGHSLLALFLKMSRTIAKNLNFQMLYLSGVLGCSSTIKSQRPELSEDQCKSIANKALKLRRGSKVYGKKGTYSYVGGTDSQAYNFMMKLANRQPLPSKFAHLQTDSLPRTPMLGSAMSEAITEANCDGDYLTSRANWTIQSSGADLLHTMLVITDHFYEAMKLDAQFMFSYHDEIWNLVHAKHTKQATWVGQIAHLLSWAYFFQRLQFKDMPYQYMFFSSVNEDKAFRKEVYESQITASNPVDLLQPGVSHKPAELAATFTS